MPRSIDRRLFLGGAAGAAATAGAVLIAPGADAGSQVSAAVDLKSFSRIDGTPVYYWRNNPGNHNPVTWRCTPNFYDRLVVWIRELRQFSRDAGYGSVDFLASAGFYVNKPGQHGAGTAMDLDVVHWADGKVSSPLNGHHNADSLKLRRRYLGVEATLRRRFCYVLDGWYPNHTDHFHADFAQLPTLLRKNSESATNFIQATCNRFMGSGLAIDGDWGSNTEREYGRMRNRLGISGDPTASIDVYRTLLARIARHGFRDTAF